MSKFHKLIVRKITRETPDAVAIDLLVPENLKNDFHYTQGQYLTFCMQLNGKEIRRSYSLCSAPSVDQGLRVAVKEVKNGQMSTFLNQKLKEGDVLEVMTPTGNFYTKLNSSNKNHYVGIAAGSGITPIISIIKETLHTENQSSFTLIFGNKSADSVIFANELKELSKKFANRLSIIHVFSRVDKGADYHFRLNKDNIEKILQDKNLWGAQHYFICGPEELIMNSNAVLSNNNIKKEQIHFELFTTPVLMAENTEKSTGNEFSGDAAVTVNIDGIETSFSLSGNGQSILDAAMDAGADAPFSCKGAVCCTCKAKVIKGKARMDMNYALTDKEVEDGFILTCQSHPTTAEIYVDFDVN